MSDRPGAALRGDGRLLAVGGRHATYLWELPGPVGGSAERVRLWVEAATGQALDEQGRVRRLSAAEVEQRRRELDRLGGPPPAEAGAAGGPRSAPR